MKADTTPAADIEMIRRTVAYLLEPGHVAELRLPHSDRGTVSGYYNNPSRLAEDAAQWSGRAEGVYVTLNPVRPDLLARAANRTKEFAKATTTDADILRRRWLLIDCDPVRPSGISSTEEEHAAALARAQAVACWLQEHGVSEPILADSGNGAHLLVRVDLPNDAVSLALLTRCLAALDLHFSDAGVCIDQKTANAARISKVYGTLAAKGDSTSTRPHRLTAILEEPLIVDVCSRDALERVAALAPAPPSAANGAGRDAFDLQGFLTRHQEQLRVVRTGPWQGGVKWILSPCPWDESHTNAAAYIVQHPSGAIAAGCHHNGCRGRDWHALRDLLEPGRRVNEHARAEGGRIAAEALPRAPVRSLVVPASALEAPAVTYCVDTLVPAGMLTVLSGRDKRGKTLLAQEIARAVVRGQPLFGELTVKSGPVVGAFLDDPLSLTLGRLDTLDVRQDPRLYLVSPLDYDGDALSFLAHLEVETLALKASLVIIDALYLLSPTTHDAGNDASRMTPLMRQLDHLATTTGAAVIIVAHDNKAGADVAGSYAIRAMAKSILRLTLPRGEEQNADADGPPVTARRVLTVESKLVPAQALMLELRNVGDWALLGTPDEVRVKDVEIAIVAFLTREREASDKEIQDNVEGRRKAKQQGLANLRNKGRVIRSGAGKKGDPFIYSLASDDHAARASDPAQKDSGTRSSPIGRVPEIQTDLTTRFHEPYSGTGQSGTESGRVPEFLTPETGPESVEF